LRFTVHRPLDDEVSLCCYRPSGGDVACSVHVGVARPRLAGHTRKNRLALAVFACDMPTGGASLRRESSRDAFDATRSLMVKPGNQLAPRLSTDRAVETPFLRDLSTGPLRRPARGPDHYRHVEILDPNNLEPARQIGRGLLNAVPAPIRFACSEAGDRQLRPPAAVGVPLGSGKALLQPTQPRPLTTAQPRSTQQLPGRQCRRHRNTSIHTDHAAIGRSRERVRDVGEGDVPSTGAITANTIGLDAFGHRPRASESHPSHLGYPHPPITVVELFEMARLQPNLPKAFLHAGLAPRRATMVAGKEVPHGLGEVPQGLLLHCLRPFGQPQVFGARLGQLRRLLVVTRRATARPPKLLLLYGQIPDEPRMPAMLQQHHLLRRCRQQPVPRHTRNLEADTDNNRHCSRTPCLVGFRPWHECPAFQPKEFGYA
jgi:hypothetical protein